MTVTSAKLMLSYQHVFIICLLHVLRTLVEKIHQTLSLLSADATDWL